MRTQVVERDVIHEPVMRFHSLHPSNFKPNGSVVPILTSETNKKPPALFATARFM